MTTAQKSIVAVIAAVALVAGFLAGSFVHSSGSYGTTNNVGDLRQLVTWFTNTTYFGKSQQASIDASGNVSTTGTLTVGSTGSTVTQGNFGTCNLNFGTVPTAIAASSSVTRDCQATNMLSSATAVQAALTGVQTGDNVSISLSTTTPNTYLGFDCPYVSASSTPGYLTVTCFNGTGASFTPGTTTTAGLQYTSRR